MVPRYIQADAYLCKKLAEIKLSGCGYIPTVHKILCFSIRQTCYMYRQVYVCVIHPGKPLEQASKVVLGGIDAGVTQCTLLRQPDKQCEQTLYNTLLATQTRTKQRLRRLTGEAVVPKPFSLVAAIFDFTPRQGSTWSKALTLRHVSFQRVTFDEFTRCGQRPRRLLHIHEFAQLLANQNPGHLRFTPPGYKSHVDAPSAVHVIVDLESRQT